MVLFCHTSSNNKIPEDRRLIFRIQLLVRSPCCSCVHHTYWRFIKCWCKTPSPTFWCDANVTARGRTCACLLRRWTWGAFRQTHTWRMMVVRPNAVSVGCWSPKLLEELGSAGVWRIFPVISALFEANASVVSGAFEHSTPSEYGVDIVEKSSVFENHKEKKHSIKSFSKWERFAHRWRALDTCHEVDDGSVWKCFATSFFVKKH